MCNCNCACCNVIGPGPFVPKEDRPVFTEEEKEQFLKTMKELRDKGDQPPLLAGEMDFVHR